MHWIVKSILIATPIIVIGYGFIYGPSNSIAVGVFMLALGVSAIRRLSKLEVLLEDQIKFEQEHQELDPFAK